DDATIYAPPDFDILVVDRYFDILHVLGCMCTIAYAKRNCVWRKINHQDSCKKFSILELCIDTSARNRNVGLKRMKEIDIKVLLHAWRRSLLEISCPTKRIPTRLERTSMVVKIAAYHTLPYLGLINGPEEEEEVWVNVGSMGRRFRRFCIEHPDMILRPSLTDVKRKAIEELSGVPDENKVIELRPQ
nr:hypothetical protein [Tanacetum cinerariifolium]